MKLSLVEPHHVEGQIILVHLHVVAQILIAGCRRQPIAVSTVYGRKTRIEHIAHILVVERGVGHLCPTRGLIQFAIGKGILSYILVIGKEVERKAVVGSIA